MPVSKNAIFQYESERVDYAMEALTDSGDRKNFTSNTSLFSMFEGSAPDIRLDGVLTGGTPGGVEEGIVQTSESGSDDMVDTVALTCYLAGVLESVSTTTDVAVARAITDPFIIHSVTVSSAGAIAVVSGSESTEFSEVRDAAGGPPLIPVGSIEVGQVRLSSLTPGPVTADEIFSTVGTHLERADRPLYESDVFAGTVALRSALPLIHVGPAIRGLYAAYSEPVFTDLDNADNFSPPEVSQSTNSIQTYSGNSASTSSSLGQGSLDVEVASDGITDTFIGLKGARLWYRFYQDKFNTANIIMNGVHAVVRTFPSDALVSYTCSLSVEQEAQERIS